MARRQTLRVPTEGACAGHLCDGCARCLAGDCCGLDVSEAGLPLEGSWPGPSFGQVGVLRSNALGFLVCACCGALHEDLSKHVRAHNLTADAYRSLWGLNSTTPLISERLRVVKSELGRQHGHRLLAEEGLRPTPEQRSRWARHREARAQTRIRRGQQPRTPVGVWRPASEGPIKARLAPKEFSMIRRVLLFIALLGATFMFSAVTAHATASPEAGCAVAVSGGAAMASGCPSGALIATYKYAPGATLEGGFAHSMPQSLFDHGTESASLPPCGPWQADVFTGDVLPVIDASHQYSFDNRLLAHLEGDAGTCEVEATTSTTTTSTTSTTLGTSTTVAPTTTVAPKQLARTGSKEDHLERLAGFLLIAGGLLILASVKASRASDSPRSA